VAAYLLHVSIAVWVGTVDAGRGLVAAGAAGAAGDFTAAVLAVCWPVQFATTIPVTIAVTITRAVLIPISFQWLLQLLRCVVKGAQLSE
jgi:hypothetical protein